MSYKPFKVNKGEYHNQKSPSDEKKGYKDYYYQDRQKIERETIARMKTFGLRSGKAWKMMPAIAYYLFFGFYIIRSICGEFVVFDFEWYDVILVIIKYIFITTLLLGPLLFLSDYRYVRYLPLFNSGVKKNRILGIIIVSLISIAIIYACRANLSKKYYDSTLRYYDEIDEKTQEYIQNNNLEIMTEDTKK